MPTKLYYGDSLALARTFPSNLVTSIVTDPPYGLAFMGKDWDHGIPGVAYWSEFLRISKPGAHLLAFGGTRTFHRLACAIEDAGWEIRDCIMWVYGSGFPKSHDLSKAIDANILTGKSNSRNIKEVIKQRPGDGRETATLPNNGMMSDDRQGGTTNDNPVTEEARQWQGWGTALKPAWEPILVARKPISNSVAETAMKYGTGGLNIDGCRVGDEVREASFSSFAPCYSNALGGVGTQEARRGTQGAPKTYVGRWPANLIHDGCDEVLGLFPDTGRSGTAVQRNGGGQRIGGNGIYRGSEGLVREDVGYADEGSAARFFYCAKSSTSERQIGCESLFWQTDGPIPIPVTEEVWRSLPKNLRAKGNIHPTVKPLKLCEYLTNLVKPPANGVLLDPFCGSGSTLLGGLTSGYSQVIGFDNWSVAAIVASERLRSKVGSWVDARWGDCACRVWR